MSQPTLVVVFVLVILVAGCGRGDDAGSGSPTPLAASCVETYSPATLVKRAFAFDGTIVSVERRRDPRLPSEEAEPWVTFLVNRWYWGGSAREVGVWIDFLNRVTSAGTINGELGTRLLVAGEARWGGPPLDNPIAWSCGFTQPYTKAAAAEWEAATSASATRRR